MILLSGIDIFGFTVDKTLLIVTGAAVLAVIAVIIAVAAARRKKKKAAETENDGSFAESTANRPEDGKDGLKNSAESVVLTPEKSITENETTENDIAKAEVSETLQTNEKEKGENNMEKTKEKATAKNSAAKTAAKPATKTAAKPAAKPTAKPVAKTSEKAAPKQPVKAAPKKAAPGVIYHVTQRRSSDKKWQVKKQGSDKAIKLFDTQAEAMEFVKGLQENNQNASMQVHKRTGQIRKV